MSVVGLKRKTFAGVKWTSLSTIIVTGIQFVQVIFLARLLSPREYGLMGMVNLVIGLAQIVSDMGMSAAIIQKQEISRTQLSTLYWMNISIGALLYLVLLGISPLSAEYFGEPTLTTLFPIAALTLLINPFATQYLVLRQKELHFGFLASQDMTVAFAGALCSVVMAFMGYGVWSLVFGGLASSFVNVVYTVVPGWRRWRPSFSFSLRDVRYFLKFGSYQLGERVTTYMTYRFDQLVIGSLLGTTALGYYNFAFNLVMKPASRLNPIVTRVVFPVFAKVQEEAERLRRGYIQILQVLTSINAPLFVGLAALAPIAMPVFFGTKWNDAIAVVQILSIYAVVRSTGNPIGSLLLARGRPDIGFKWNVAVLIVLVPSIYFSSKIGGLIGVAWSLLLLESVQMYFLYYVVRHVVGRCGWEYFIALGRPMMLSGIMAAAMVLVAIPLGSLSPKATVFAEIGVGAVVYLLLLSRFEREMLVEIRSLAFNRTAAGGTQ